MPRPRRTRAKARALLGLLALVLALPPTRAGAVPSQLSTIAGGVGDGGRATTASLRDAYSVAADQMGNTYVADSAHNRVRMIASNGTISTVAGKDGYGYNGDGGLATNAALYAPFGVAIDTDGSLLIADTKNNRVRKVAKTGLITTVAGAGVPGFSGDGGPATAAK